MLRLWSNKILFLLVFSLMALALVAVACGGDDEAAAPASTEPTAAAPVATTAAATPSGPQPTATRATGAFRAEPTATGSSAAVPTPVPTAAPAMMAGEPKVDTLVISVDPSAGETNLPLGWHCGPPSADGPRNGSNGRHRTHHKRLGP